MNVNSYQQLQIQYSFEYYDIVLKSVISVVDEQLIDGVDDDSFLLNKLRANCLSLTFLDDGACDFTFIVSSSIRATIPNTGKPSKVSTSSSFSPYYLSILVRMQGQLKPLNQQ